VGNIKNGSRKWQHNYEENEWPFWPQTAWSGSR
jgi:hypothetical protein